MIQTNVFGSLTYNPDLVVKVQNVQAYYDTERVELRSYIPKTETKVDDYSIAPLTGLGSSWSVTFDWFAKNGNLAYPAGIVDTLPIATIKGSEGKYLKLYWDRTAYNAEVGGMTFKLTDGTNILTLGQEQLKAMTWLHNDFLKFAITSDGELTSLYCYNPENKAIHGTAILSNINLNMDIDVPTSISLGTNEDESIIGTGIFANIRGFDSVLIIEDIADVFDSVNDLIPTLGISKSRIFGGL
jgi:hypothetical protein